MLILIESTWGCGKSLIYWKISWNIGSTPMNMFLFPNRKCTHWEGQAPGISQQKKKKKAKESKRWKNDKSPREREMGCEVLPCLKSLDSLKKAKVKVVSLVCSATFHMSLPNTKFFWRGPRWSSSTHCRRCAYIKCNFVFCSIWQCFLPYNLTQELKSLTGNTSEPWPRQKWCKLFFAILP